MYDEVAGGEFVAGTGLDEADGFDAEDAGELHDGGGRVAAAGEDLGAVETEGFDADEAFAFLGDGDGEGLELEDRGGAAGGADDCLHCLWRHFRAGDAVEYGGAIVAVRA